MSALILWAIPASMLYTGRYSDAPAVRLVMRGLDSLKVGLLEEAERRAQEALEVARWGSHPVGEGMAALVLSNIYWMTGRIQPALDRAKRAREIFKQQAAPDQRHNEAVAALNLGLVYHLMGNYSGALNEYYTARQWLDTARQHWTDQKEEEQKKRCDHLMEWIEHLIERLIESAPLERQPTLFFPVGSADGAKAALWGEYSRDTSLLLDGKTLRIVPLQDRLVVLTADCCVFPVPPQMHPMIQAQAGQVSDYVLAQLGDPLPGDPFHISLDSQGILNFLRQPDGHIIGTVQPVRILGGVKPQNYRPIALLI
ncbi:MAG: hypothetical protein ACP5N6_08210 [Anaerolineae bacterium]